MRAGFIIGMLILISACTASRQDQRHQGWYILRLVEKPSSRGASHQARPEDCTRFVPVTSFDMQDPAKFDECKAMLREGDVIAYWMKKNEAHKAVGKGQLSKIGYRLLSYGHLGILVEDPADKNKLLLFSSQSFQGPNTKEGVDTLKDHSWDAYRLDQWNRIDTDRLHEFVALSKAKAGNRAGYDFSGMFGLWNSNLEPDKAEKIGRDYICSTIVVAALYYSGLKLDAVQRMGMFDLVSPRQVVDSPGCIIPLPDVTIVKEETKRPR